MAVSEELFALKIVFLLQRSLRSGFLGQLRMNPILRSYGLQDLLPPKTDIPEEGCTRTNENQFCFDAGMLIGRN